MLENELTKSLKDCLTPIDFFVRGDLSIKENLRFLQGRHLEHKIIYFYVVDEKHRLLGIVPTRKMLLSDPHTLINDIMDKTVIKAHINQTVLEAIELMEKS